MPYKVEDFASHIECVKKWYNPKPSRPRVSWQLPQMGVFKWKTDGASRGNPGHVGMGGVLHDEKGQKLCSFSSYIGVKGTNEAEFMAMVTTMEIKALDGRLLNKELQFESDFTTAVSWETNWEGVPWSIRFMRNKFFNLQSCFIKVTVKHE